LIFLGHLKQKKIVFQLFDSFAEFLPYIDNTVCDGTANLYWYTNLYVVPLILQSYICTVFISLVFHVHCVYVFQTAHLALIDALMQAFSREIMSVERVTQVVRRFASFNASSELPSDTEDAILFWVNKVCVTVQKRLEAEQDNVIEGGETNQKVDIVMKKLDSFFLV